MFDFIDKQWRTDRNAFGQRQGSGASKGRSRLGWAASALALYVGALTTGLLRQESLFIFYGIIANILQLKFILYIKRKFGVFLKEQFDQK